MQHVGTEPVAGEVPARGTCWEFVGPQDRGVGHPGRLENASPYKLVVAGAARSLDEQGQHDVPTVVVGEALAGGEDRRMTSQNGEVRLGGGELMYRDREGVAGHVVEPVLVEVIADAGSVRKQMLHGDVVCDLG